MLAWPESMQHQVDHGNLYHRFTAGRQSFVIFAQATVSAKPGERTFNNPSFGKHDELVQFRSLDNLDDPAEGPLAPNDELAGIAAIGPDQLQATESAPQPLDRQHAAFAILNIAGMHHDGQDQSQRVDDDVPLSAVDFLARVVAVRPPFRGASVLTDCESITAAEGVGCLPAWRRTFSRSLS